MAERSGAPDGGKICTCRLINVTPIDRDPNMNPELLRGDPMWCPRHDPHYAERVAKRAAVERLARYGC